MKAAELLDQAKTKTGTKSDYALAKRLNLPKQSLPGIRAGTRPLPLDTAYRLAIILQQDPAQVVAELAAERETNPERADFWRSFLSRAVMLVATLACTLAWSFSAGVAAGPAGAGFGSRRKCA